MKLPDATTIDEINGGVGDRTINNMKFVTKSISSITSTRKFGKEKGGRT